MKYRIFITLFVLSLCVPQKTHAVTPVSVPFGGPILVTYECACTGGWLIVLYDQSKKIPIPLTFQFGLSELKANYNIFTPGAQTLGTNIIGGWCSPASTECAGFPTAGTITTFPLSGIGTSVI